MVISEVRIKLCEMNSERLLAFCSVTFDGSFVVRDLKIIEGTKGLFVAMPSRKLTDRCRECGCKNHLKACFCNLCGGRLDNTRALRDPADGRPKMHADIAHPIHAAAREMVQSAVVRAYAEERDRAQMPGYVCRYDEYDAGDIDEIPMSYAGMVADAAKQSRSHAPHTAGPRGPRMTTSPVNSEVRSGG